MSEAIEELLPRVQRAFRRRRVRPTAEQETQLATYLATMLRWNETHNLTSIRDADSAIERHLVEPSLIMPMLDGAGPVLLDVGTGAGVPGVTLAILDPDRTVRLVEASAKKAAFLREVAGSLGLRRVEVIEGRLEALIQSGELHGPVHVITARAWTSGWGEMLGLVAPLMVSGGRAILLVGEEVLRSLRRNLAAGTDLARPADPEWRRAAAAGWQLKRAMNLPHLDHAYAVALEFPSR